MRILCLQPVAEWRWAPSLTSKTQSIVRHFFVRARPSLPCPMGYIANDTALNARPDQHRGSSLFT